MKTCIGFVLVAFASCGAFATDLTVGPAGSGAQFTSIQAAVDAAQPGDRVLVFAGAYTGAVFVDKAIDLVGAGSSVTFSRTFATVVPGLIDTPIVVANLGQGARVRVSGFTFATIGTMVFPNAAMMEVHDCLGRVELSDIELPGASLPFLPASQLGGILYVRDCAQVVASGIRALGAPTSFLFPIPGSPNLVRGHAGLLAERAALWLDHAQASGNATRLVTSGYGGDGGAGLQAIDSVVHVAHAVLQGAQSAGAQTGVIGSGGAGIDAAGSWVLLHGGPGNAVIGANAVEANFSSVNGLGLAGSAIALDAASSATYAIDVVLTPGSGTTTLPGAPAVAQAPGATVLALAHRLPTVAMTPGTVALGAMLTLELAGEPGVDHLRAVALATAPAFQFPGVTGALLIDLAAVLALDVQPLDGTGVFTTGVAVPMDPALTGILVVVQGAQVLPGGIVLAPPAMASIGF